MSIDYRSFSKDGSEINFSKVNKQWWSCKDDDELANSIGAVLEQINSQDRQRQYQYSTSSKLYGNIDLMSLAGLSVSRVVSSNYATRDRMSYNIVQSAIDTITAKISKNKPKPLFLTSGGNYKQQRRAKKLDKFVEGVFYENDAYALGTMTFRDGAINGDGVTHVFAKDGRVKFERVMPEELKVDMAEAFYGDPRQMHRVKSVDRQILLELFPDKKGDILLANNATAALSGAAQIVADQVVVCESWHLPSGEKSKDGLHTISIPGRSILFKEEYKKSFFPFAKFSWCPRQKGYWAQGVAEQIQNIQLELNKILWVEQRSFHLAGTFKVMIENGSKVVKEHINNEVGTLVYYTGKEPNYVTPPVLPPGFNERKQFLIQSAFESVGVSQLSAGSKKPDGLDSGKALREYNNIETERFMTIGQAYEKYYLDLARLTVDCARDIYAETKELRVKSPNSRFIESIDWKDVQLDEEDMIMKIFPISSLPSDPSGRLQTIQEMVQAGWITPRTARRAMDYPDLEMMEELGNAKEDYLHKCFDKMIDDGEFTPPEPFDDLQMGKSLFLDYYAYAKVNGVEESKLNLLRQFNDQIDVLVQAACPPPPPQGGLPSAGGGPSPQAAPMAPPQSDLIQNVPGAA